MKITANAPSLYFVYQVAARVLYPIFQNGGKARKKNVLEYARWITACNELLEESMEKKGYSGYVVF